MASRTGVWGGDSPLNVSENDMWTCSPVKQGNITTRFRKALKEDLRQAGKHCQVSKHHHEVRVPVIGISNILIILSLRFVLVDFMAIKHIRSNPTSISIVKLD